MFITIDGELWDFDLELLGQLLALIDKQLNETDRQIEQCPDPDSFGVYDSAEGITGLGFAACQQYLAAKCGCAEIEKKHAFNLGPRHSSGMTIAEIIDYAANYWKHKGESGPTAGNEKYRAKTVAALKKLGIDPDKDYVLTCVLAQIAPTKPERFWKLMAVLEEWRTKLKDESQLKTSQPK